MADGRGRAADGGDGRRRGMALVGRGGRALGAIASRPAEDSALLEAVDVLCAELCCRRPIEVRECYDLVTAATIGWRRPVLLVPAEWKTWTPEQLRAVLAHEIAHARGHDYLALLLGRLGLMLHFYHPLLHWLMNRLRLEQELAADAAAASISGGQQQYLTTIAEIALRSQDRPMLWPARTFLPTQTTFLRRISMLRDSKLRFDRVSPFTRWTTVGIVLLCGALVAGLRGPGIQPRLFAADNDAAADSQGAAAGDARTFCPIPGPKARGFCGGLGPRLAYRRRQVYLGQRSRRRGKGQPVHQENSEQLLPDRLVVANRRTQGDAADPGDFRPGENQKGSQGDFGRDLHG